MKRYVCIHLLIIFVCNSLCAPIMCGGRSNGFKKVYNNRHRRRFDKKTKSDLRSKTWGSKFVAPKKKKQRVITQASFVAKKQKHVQLKCSRAIRALPKRSNKNIETGLELPKKLLRYMLYSLIMPGIQGQNITVHETNGTNGTNETMLTSIYDICEQKKEALLQQVNFKTVSHMRNYFSNFTIALNDPINSIGRNITCKYQFLDETFWQQFGNYASVGVTAAAIVVMLSLCIDFLVCYYVKHSIERFTDKKNQTNKELERDIQMMRDIFEAEAQESDLQKFSEISSSSESQTSTEACETTESTATSDISTDISIGDSNSDSEYASEYESEYGTELCESSASDSESESYYSESEGESNSDSMSENLISYPGFVKKI